MNEITKINAIVELENKLRDAEQEFDNNNEVYQELRLLHEELKLLPNEANAYLRSLLLEYNRRDVTNYQILQEYEVWFKNRIMTIVNRIISIVNDSKLSVLQNEICSSEYDTNLIKHEICLNTYISLPYESKKLSRIEEKIGNITKSSINRLDREILRFICIAEECLCDSTNKINKIEHEIDILKNKLEIHMENKSQSHKGSISFSPDVINEGNIKDSRSTSENDNASSHSDVNPTTLDSNGFSASSESTGQTLVLGALCGGVPGLLLGLGLSSIFGFNKKKNASTATSSESTDLTNASKTKTCKSEEDICLTKAKSAVYAPSEVNRGDSVIIQVYVYTQNDEEKVSEIAAEIDNNATRRNYIPLSSMIKRGDKIRLAFRCYSRSIELEETSSEGIWTNDLFKHEFVVYVPEDYNRSNFICSVNLFINDIPVGDMKFKINVVDYEPRKLWAEIKSNRYKKSFISYSHADAEKIRFLAEGFKIQGIDYFFDEHSLRTGDNYPKEIDDYISSCDVFVLCWSENAKASDWVRREYNMALQRYDKESDKLKIYPISIVPKADLPSTLQKIFHFGKIE